MKEKTKDWLKAISSILLFNLVILGTLIGNKLINFSTITLKILLDIAIAFSLDKSITKLKVNLKDGFSIERK